ncbi:MAG: N-6 DNA methylase [Bacteroidales bacterium]|nr:N-6 DNA methylase [Bacteroidales bacterium]
MTNKEFKKLKNDLWLAANKLRADSDLKSNDYSTPVLGIIFLKFADIKYSKYEKEIISEFNKNKGTRIEQSIDKIAIEKCGIYLPDYARYDFLKELSADKEIDKAVIEAMKGIEKHVISLKDTLPKDEFYDITRKGQTLLKQLLKIFSTIPEDTTGDLLGKIYEFFLEKFGLEEAQKGGEFFTPTSVVSLMVEYIEPYHGKIFDPACGSGGMFVQSNNFILRHHLQKGSVSPISVYGQEKTLGTVKLAKMNLAINGLRGEIKQGDSYSEDLYDSFGKFDFVMANPPFNVKEVNEDTVKKDRRFTEYGLPKSKSKTKKGGVINIPNGNYLWISLFATSLNEKGRAALVMANSASDAGHSEYDIRKTLVRKGLINGMLTLPGNMFSTVTLPATLWFFDKSKSIEDFEPEKDKIEILFVDARNVYHQVDRAHREFTFEQLQNIAAIQHLRKGDRKFFIELVKSHYEGAADRMPVLKQLLESASSELEKQISAFLEWTRNRKTENGVAEIIEKESFFTKLESLKVINIKPVIERIETWLGFHNSLTDKNKADKVEEANRLQRELLKISIEMLHNYLHLKKELEKDYREYERLFKLAEDHLRNKDDKEWKELNKPKEIRLILDRLNEYSSQVKNNNYEEEEKSPVYLLKMAEWLQERFPKAEYEDVTGLCKLTNIKDIEEQDYSLNPGRYVGVIIEEDGLTADEFEEMIKKGIDQFNQLSSDSRNLEEQINKMLKQFQNG